MNTGDYIVLGIIAVVLTAIVIYLVRQRKKGVKCIGCPYSSKCGSYSGNCTSNNKTN